jgi:hypothetical protein
MQNPPVECRVFYAGAAAPAQEIRRWTQRIFTMADASREAARRAHKLAAMFLAYWAWTRGADCVCVQRSHWLPFIGLERVKNPRLDWFEDDVRPTFPYFRALDETGRKKHGSIFLSRKRFPPDTFMGSMSDDARMAKLTAEGVVTVPAMLPSASKAVEVLARMSYGISDFPTKGEVDRWGKL